MNLCSQTYFKRQLNGPEKDPGFSTLDKIPIRTRSIVQLDGHFQAFQAVASSAHITLKFHYQYICHFGIANTDSKPMPTAFHLKQSSSNTRSSIKAFPKEFSHLGQLASNNE